MRDQGGEEMKEKVQRRAVRAESEGFMSSLMDQMTDLQKNRRGTAKLQKIQKDGAMGG